MDLLIQTLINGLILGAGYALVAVGLTVIFGTLHIVNFAHGAFFALGAYATLLIEMIGLATRHLSRAQLEDLFWSQVMTPR